MASFCLPPTKTHSLQKARRVFCCQDISSLPHWRTFPFSRQCRDQSQWQRLVEPGNSKAQQSPFWLHPSQMDRRGGHGPQCVGFKRAAPEHHSASSGGTDPRAGLPWPAVHLQFVLPRIRLRTGEGCQQCMVVFFLLRFVIIKIYHKKSWLICPFTLWGRRLARRVLRHCPAGRRLLPGDALPRQGQSPGCTEQRLGMEAPAVPWPAVFRDSREEREREN